MHIVIYLILFAILTVFSTIYLRKKAKNSYPIDILLLLILMLMFTYEVVCIYTIIITLIAIAMQLILKRINTKKSKYTKTEKENNSEIPIAFYMCVANILTLIATNFYIFYCIG